MAQAFTLFILQLVSSVTKKYNILGVIYEFLFKNMKY